MREFLVTKFVCARCGSKLAITYNVPKGSGQYLENEPTGAHMVEQLVAVEPCESCAKPMEELRKAVQTLLSA